MIPQILNALLQELSSIPSSGEIHQEQIYRTTLQTHTTDVNVFIKLLVYNVDNLTTHSFITKSQAQHLKQNKEEITETECDSHGLCWKLSLCGAGWNPGISLEQEPVYHASCDDIFQEGLCTSSHLTAHHLWWSWAWHLFCSWAELQRIVMLYIKENLPQIKRANYFIDSYAGQYKNYKAFLNLCHHKSDFGIDATWVFVATSHWKSPCDGIDSTVKCKKLFASLQRTVNNQILTFLAIKEYCRSSI